MRFETRGQFEAWARGDKPIVERGPNWIRSNVLHDQFLYLDPEDESITPCIIHDGFWEAWISICFSRIIHPGMTCVDVGANMGYYSMLMWLLSGGRIFAVEPNPKLVALLRMSFPANVKIMPMAVSDHEGIAELSIPEKYKANSTIVSRVESEQSLLDVSCASIDFMFFGIPVDFIKIDVEGAEQLAWKGMQNTVHRLQNLTTVIEVNTNRYPDTAREFYESMERIYHLRYITFDGEILPTTVERLMEELPTEDWMLYLHKDSNA